MNGELREGFYHRDAGTGRREALSFRRESAGFTIMRTLLREERPGHWEWDGPVRTLLTTRDRAAAETRLRELMTSGEWRWSATLR
jgi:hypothetical protein